MPKRKPKPAAPKRALRASDRTWRKLSARLPQDPLTPEITADIEARIRVLRAAERGKPKAKPAPLRKRGKVPTLSKARKGLAEFARLSERLPERDTTPEEEAAILAAQREARAELLAAERSARKPFDADDYFARLKRLPPKQAPEL